MGVEHSDNTGDRTQAEPLVAASVHNITSAVRSQPGGPRRTQISDFVHLCGNRAFERDFQRMDFDVFLDNFERAIEQGTRIRLADEAEVVAWRPHLVELLAATLEVHMEYFENEYSVCKMIILECVDEGFDGLWFYSVGRRENAAFVWRPEGWV